MFGTEVSEFDYLKISPVLMDWEEGELIKSRSVQPWQL